jgi:CxxC motif-containing protein (DUF1111 family)
MKTPQVAIAVVLSFFTVIVLSPPDADAENRRARFTHHGKVDSEGPAVPDEQAASSIRSRQFTEAPAAFDNESNGFLDQGPDFESLDDDNVEPLRSFNDNRFIFEETETLADGLGPVYNAQSCRECHQNVVTGGASQVAEHRTGRLDGDAFFESIGGSLIHSRATHPDIAERVVYEDNISTFRISTNTLGAGFVEAVANSTLMAIRDRQHRSIRGTLVEVPVLEAGGAVRLGRFGWKGQHASLESFAADAYLNEMGITSVLLPEENTSSGIYVGYDSEYDTVEDPEDDGIDVIAFADFMRATKAPPRGEITPEVQAGEQVFAQIGCADCHISTLFTSSAGTEINGGAFTVPDALGDKKFHPYSDFLLHDIGTGDGIPVLPTSEYGPTANMMRTAPLWGLRTRNRLMHDGLTFTERDAIERHKGQARKSRSRFIALSDYEQAVLLAFLNSL